MKDADAFQIKMILGLFTIDKGKIKVFLIKKGGEPYKGYWILPSKGLSYKETFEQNTHTLLTEYVGLENVYTEVFKAFEDKEEALSDKVVHVSTLALVDDITATYKRKELEQIESNWFDIDSFPKLGYNHEEVIVAMIEYLKQKIKTTHLLKLLFPSDFTLPEMQSVCEQIEGHSLDRRNFRKKILSLDIIEDTGFKNETTNGRPAKLYRFKEDVEKLNLF